eukprot:176320-Chlamydomonas_euryale.AAC.2
MDGRMIDVEREDACRRRTVARRAHHCKLLFRALRRRAICWLRADEVEAVCVTCAGRCVRGSDEDVGSDRGRHMQVNQEVRQQQLRATIVLQPAPAGSGPLHAAVLRMPGPAIEGCVPEKGGGREEVCKGYGKRGSVQGVWAERKCARGMGREEVCKGYGNVA